MEHDITPGAKGLIFDLDGTLVDSMPLHYRSWKTACKTYGIDLSIEYLEKHAGTPGWLIAKDIIEQNNLHGKVTFEQIINDKLQLFRDAQKDLKPVEPVVEIVKKYYGKIPMSVGTGGQRNTVHKSLEITGLLGFFDIIITSNDIQRFKPDPETFLKCAEAMGIEPSSIEVFEDGDLGLQAAKRAGMIATNVKDWYDSSWVR